MKNLWPYVLLACVLALPTQAQETTLKIANSWARESPPGVSNGAAYMTVTNLSDQVDRLLAASAEVAGTVEIHTHLMEDGMMAMRQVTAVEIAPGEPAVFEPGGLHLMLIGLHQPLRAGDSFPLTLSFERAGEMTVEFTVHNPNVMSPSGMNHDN